MRATCLTRRRQPRSSKRLPQASTCEVNSPPCGIYYRKGDSLRDEASPALTTHSINRHKFDRESKKDGKSSHCQGPRWRVCGLHYTTDRFTGSRCRLSHEDVRVQHH